MTQRREDRKISGTKYTEKELDAMFQAMHDDMVVIAYLLERAIEELHKTYIETGNQLPDSSEEIARKEIEENSAASFPKMGKRHLKALKKILDNQ